MNIFISVFLCFLTLLILGLFLLSRNKIQPGQKTNPARLGSLAVISIGLFVIVGIVFILMLMGGSFKCSNGFIFAC